jgi:hypothetical protein
MDQNQKELKQSHKTGILQDIQNAISDTHKILATFTKLSSELGKLDADVGNNIGKLCKISHTSFTQFKERERQASLDIKKSENQT